jgi:SSS family solute:Na+ symporter
MWSLIANVVVTVVVSLFTKPKPEHELKELVYRLTDLVPEGHFSFFRPPIVWAAAGGLSVCCIKHLVLVRGAQ